MGRGGDIDFIFFLQAEVTVRDIGFPFPLDRADKHIDLGDFIKLGELLPVEQAALTQNQFNDLHFSLGKRVPPQERRELKQFKGFSCGREFGVDGQAQPQFFLQEDQLFRIFGIADAGNRVRIPELARNDAAKHIQFIRRGCRDQQITVCNIRLLLYFQARAVAMHDHDVERLDRFLQNVLIAVDDYDVVPFFRELFGQIVAHLAIAYNYNLHPLGLPFKLRIPGPHSCHSNGSR